MAGQEKTVHITPRDIFHNAIVVGDYADLFALELCYAFSDSSSNAVVCGDKESSKWEELEQTYTFSKAITRAGAYDVFVTLNGSLVDNVVLQIVPGKRLASCGLKPPV